MSGNGEGKILQEHYLQLVELHIYDDIHLVIVQNHVILLIF